MSGVETIPLPDVEDHHAAGGDVKVEDGGYDCNRRLRVQHVES